METMIEEQSLETNRYAKCIAASRRVRWDIDRDVIRGRSFDFTKKFLPDALSKVDSLALVSPDVGRLLCEERGWSRRKHAAWVADVLKRALLPG